MMLQILLQANQLPGEFFTIQSMLTLTGATGAVYVVSNGIQHAFNYNPRWLALLIAQALAIVGVVMTSESSVGDFFVGVVNGFLIYSTAVGANQMIGNPVGQGVTPRGQVDLQGQTPSKRRFNTRWF